MRRSCARTGRCVDASRRFSRCLSTGSRAIELLSSERWDLFMLLFGESDTVCHHFWMFFDENSPRHPKGDLDTLVLHHPDHRVHGVHQGHLMPPFGRQASGFRLQLSDFS